MKTTRFQMYRNSIAVVAMFLMSVFSAALSGAQEDPADAESSAWSVERFETADIYGPADTRGGNGLTDVEDLFSEDGVLQAGPYLGIEANQDEVFDQVGFAAGYGRGIFGVAFDVMLINDDKYIPSEPFMFGHYFRLNEGMISLRPEPLSFTAGRVDHSDEVLTPYSLFISSADLPAVIADLKYDDEFFFYRTRWISLNRNWDFDQVVDIYDASKPADQRVSEQQLSRIPSDRGANYKSYGLHLGKFRFGVQESVVYLDQEFYPEYFFSPLPMYFTQLVNTRGNTEQNDEGEKPWTQERNENSLIGFFLDYTTPLSYAYMQFLMDDVNLSSLAPGFELTHPNKLAWSLGARHAFDFGTLGFYHAGATKYTFAATTVSTRDEQFSVNPYEYAYYPTVTYGDKTLWYYDNYIGYKYGENNLAFMFTYDRTFPDFDLGARLEYVVSGSKSPANPWHEDKQADGTQILDDRPLEHTVTMGGEVSRHVGKWHLTAGGELGYRFNALQLEPVDSDSTDAKQIDGVVPDIFRPAGGDHLLGTLYLGARYTLTVTPETTWDTLFLPEGTEARGSGNGEDDTFDGSPQFEITDVSYAIEGRTQEFALDARLDIEEGTVFFTQEQLESYMADKQQELRNQRVLSEESELSYTVRERAGQPDAVLVQVNAIDTWNLIAVPYPKYDSNDGLLLGIRARDYNFFGTMEELQINMDYENKIGDRDRLSGDEVWSLQTRFDWPFQWVGHDWKWSLTQNLEFDASDDIEYGLSTGMSYDFLVGARTFTANYTQQYDYLTDDNSGDGYYLTSGLSLGTSYDTGLELPVMGELKYRPSVFTDVRYKLGDQISDDRRGIEPGFKHSLTGGDRDWIGNFRQGVTGAITNTNSVNLYDGEFDRDFDAELAGYLAVDPFGFSGRGLLKASLDNNGYADGEPIRGIIDNRFDGDVGAYINSDATLKVWTIGNFVEGQGSFFFDAGAIVNTEKGFRGLDDIQAGGGIEAIGFPLFARSLYMRISLGFDLKAVLLNRSLSQREIFIGFGHHY
jgi:hypothetical protein